ncbi:pyrroloquinoline quinone biosynthesis peptide chaperone PqqD [Rhodospirillaceae bacterium AH-315-P19]|nr:pyrroloquinoline quinone biosynthesis peptide chaperone PqqD [Rhodospirillaceae bacterium AH-315-P19]
MKARCILDSEALPRLAPHVRFRFDETRAQWVVLSPERLLIPDAIAVEVLQLCDGKTSIAAMITTLAERYQTPHETIKADVLELLQDLTDQGILTL